MPERAALIARGLRLKRALVSRRLGLQPALVPRWLRRETLLLLLREPCQNRSAGAGRGEVEHCRDTVP